MENEYGTKSRSAKVHAEKGQPNFNADTTDTGKSLAAFFNELTKKLNQLKDTSVNPGVFKDDQLSVIKSKIAQGFVSSNVSVKQGISTEVRGVDNEYTLLVDKLTKEKREQDAKRKK
jgi:hypothetical protein